VVVPAGGIIVRVGGGEEKRGGRGIDVDAAFFISIFGGEVLLFCDFVWASAECDSSKTSEKKRPSNYLTLICWWGWIKFGNSVQRKRRILIGYNGLMIIMMMIPIIGMGALFFSLPPSPTRLFICMYIGSLGEKLFDHLPLGPLMELFWSFI
jgi:hypothetical protein